MGTMNNKFGFKVDTPTDTSPRGKLNGDDYTKLLKSLGLGVAGFVLVWLGDVLIPGLNLSSSWGPFVGAMAPVLINLGRKLVSGKSS